jgi:hypothetical protein
MPTNRLELAQPWKLSTTSSVVPPPNIYISTMRRRRSDRSKRSWSQICPLRPRLSGEERVEQRRFPPFELADDADEEPAAFQPLGQFPGP